MFASWKALLRSKSSSSNHAPRARTLALESLEDRTLLNGGALDTTFGTGGIVKTPGVGRSSDSLLQPDGKIVTVGSINGDFSIVRYNTDGSLDSTFGAGGKVLRDIGSSNDVALSLVRQSDGKLVIAGFTTPAANNANFALLRLNPDGSVDTSFGTGGVVATDFNGGSDEASSLVLQSDGKLVAVGRTAMPNVNDTDFALARYNSNGSLDTTFGTGGKVVSNLGTFEAAQRAALQPDGKIVVVGGPDFTVARYTTNGTLDTSFGNNGFIVTPTGGDANNVALLPDGRILVAGFSSNDTVETFSFEVARYNANGTPDLSFGGDGSITTSFGAKSAIIFGLAVQSDGKFVVSGFISTPSAVGFDNEDFILSRFNANGRLDTSFGSGGSVITDLGSDLDEANSVLIQPDGNYVEAGSSDTDITGLVRISSTFPQQQSTPSNTLFVNQLYQDLLNRDADTTGSAFFTNYLNQVPSPVRFLPPDQQAVFLRGQVAQQFVASQEYAVQTVMTVYANLLGRNVDPSGLQTWTQFLLSHGNNRRLFEAQVLGSAEFFQLAGGTNPSYLNALYQTVLQRNIDASGAQTFGAALASGVSRTAVALTLLSSLESDVLEVNRLYQEFLGRNADPGGLNFFATALLNGASQEQVIVSLVSSQEYFASL